MDRTGREQALWAALLPWSLTSMPDCNAMLDQPEAANTNTRKTPGSATVDGDKEAIEEDGTLSFEPKGE